MSAVVLPAPRFRLHRLTVMIMLVLGLGCLSWGIGFAWFVRDAMRGAADARGLPPRADGIVALTGGADRIETAMRLLTEGRANLLLVSGVAPEADLADIARRAGFSSRAVAPAVTLGHAATSTVGNAAETAAWVHAHGIRSLIVVTSGYHMERALTEIGRALPEVRLYPVAVLSPAVRDALGAGTLRLLVAEYTKFLAADLGLTHLPWSPQG